MYKDQITGKCLPVKTITKTITVALGTAAGNYPSTLDFGKEYKRIIGYYVIITKLGDLTIDKFKLGLANNVSTIQDPTLIEHFTVSTAVAIKDRFYRDEPIDVSGSPLTVSILNAAAISGSGFECQFIAQLVKE